MKKGKKRTQRKLDFFDVDRIQIVEGKGPDLINSRIAADLRASKHSTDPAKKVYVAEVDYFANFKLMFAREIILPEDVCIENAENYEKMTATFFDDMLPTNMPWQCERVLFRISGDKEYFDAFDKVKKTIDEKAFYWILDDEISWKVALFVRDKTTSRWSLYPFFAFIECRVQRNGLGLVDDIQNYCYYSDDLVLKCAPAGSPEYMASVFPLNFGIHHCLLCLRDLNLGRAHVVSEKIFRDKKGFSIMPITAGVFERNPLLANP